MKFYTITKHIAAAALLLLILLVGGWIRLRGLPNLPTGQFASNDAYLYYSHAETLVAHGTLPEVETHRWVPLGRDLTEMLHGYAYALAASYKVISVSFRDVTLYQVQRMAPTACFLIGLAVLCLFLYLRFGGSVAAVTGILLAVMPGSIQRSAAGFSDRDSWCWLLGILAVVPYLYKEGTTNKHNRYLCTTISGFFVFLGGLSWEGFGGFVLPIVVIELWRFLTTDTEENLSEYALWVLMFVPWLYLFCSAYHSGGGFSSHVTAFLLFPPLVMLILRTLRYTLTRHPRFAVFLSEQVSARALSLLLCAVCILIGLAYLVLQRETFTQSIVPFSDASVMDTVGELRALPDAHWYHRYGGVLCLTSVCLIAGAIKLWGKQSSILAATLTFFTAATFFRQYLYHVLSPGVCEYFFYGAVAFTPIAALGVAVLRTGAPAKHEHTYIAMTVWLLLWLGLARDAQRYDFFIGIPLAFFTAVALEYITTHLTQYLKIGRKAEQMAEIIKTSPSQPLRKKRRSRIRKNGRKRKDKVEHPTIQLPPRWVPQAWIKTGITLACLALLLFWEPPGSSARHGLAQRGYATRITPEDVLPGKATPMANACQWLSGHHDKNATVAAAWTHGNILNVLGGVQTVIDADHYITSWIDDYETHVAAAVTEREALEFLKTHKATHLLLTEEDVLYTASKHMHAHDTPEQPLGMVLLVPQRAAIGSPNTRMVPIHKNSYLSSVDIDFRNKPVTAMAHLKNKDIVKLPYLKHFGDTENIHPTHTSEFENSNGGILHHFDTETQRETLYYLAPHSWNSLTVKLFLRGKHSEAFVPVYPENQDTNAPIKIWKIHYPLDIIENPKYLETALNKKGASE